MVGRGQAIFQTVSEPHATDTEVIVRPQRLGVCATDLHVLYHGALVKESDLPLTLGHEFMGEVVEVRGGPRPAAYPKIREPIDIGTRVAVEPLVPCMHCVQCMQGRLNLCVRMTHLGISRDGCFAEYVSVPVSRVVPLPDEVSDSAGALIEVFACGVNFIDKARMEPGDICVVVGAGPAGLVTVQCALAAGAGAVYVLEPVPERRELAQLCGAAEVFSTPEEAHASVMEATGATGADVVFECVGNSSAVNEAIHLARKGGRVVLVGIPTGPINIDSEPIVVGELNVVGAFASSWDFDRAIAWTVSGQIKPEFIITSEVPFSDSIHALETALRDLTECKIQVAMPNVR